MKSQTIGKNIKEPPLIFSCRMSLFMLMMFATLNIMLLRTNINLGVVCMVKAPHHHTKNQTSITPSNFTFDAQRTILADNDNDVLDYNKATVDSNYVTCQQPFVDSTNQSQSPSSESGEFDWDKKTQANILGSFYYGYIFTNIAGGWVADKYGGRNGLIASIGSISVLTLLNPTAAIQGPGFLFLVRFLQGICTGACVPLINVLAARWAGHTERGFLMGVAFGGFNIAVFAANPFSAFICKNLGWSYIFYISGGIGILWCFISYFLIFDWPEDHPKISEDELEFLKQNRAVQPGMHNSKNLVVPWRSIVFSVPVNIIHFMHVCMMWGMITLGMFIPPFFREVLKMNVRTNGILSSLPFLAMLIFHMFSGSIFDAMRRRNFCTITNLRKIFNTVGTISLAICLPLMSLIPCTDNTLIIVTIFSGMSFVELALVGGYLFSVFEVAPRFSGIITGISNTFGVLPGFLCPVIAAYLTQNGTREEWLLVFYIGAAVCGAGTLAYLLFGSSELQPWAELKPKLHAEDAELAVLQKQLVSFKNVGDDEEGNSTMRLTGETKKTPS